MILKGTKFIKENGVILIVDDEIGDDIHFHEKGYLVGKVCNKDMFHSFATKIQSDDEKKKEITSLLIDLFDRINIDMPSNFDSILEFVYDDVCETADPNWWHDGDVAIAFRRWIEKDLES